jgi:hypothetical protein
MSAYLDSLCAKSNHWNWNFFNCECVSSGIGVPSGIHKAPLLEAFVQLEELKHMDIVWRMPNVDYFHTWS